MLTDLATRVFYCALSIRARLSLPLYEHWQNVEFTRCLSTLSSKRRVPHSDVSFQTKQSVCSITVELTPHTHLSLSKTLFYPNCLLPTVTVTPSDSNCFKKSDFLKRFSWIIFTFNELVDRIRNFKSNASHNDEVFL